MLAFDDTMTMFTTEFLLSDMNSSSPSFDDLGASPNPTDTVMDFGADLLFGSGSDDRIGSQLQSSGSFGYVDQEDCVSGELVNLLTGDDPQDRTDSHVRDDGVHDDGDDEEFAGRSGSEEFLQSNMAAQSDRRDDHDYDHVNQSSGDEDDDGLADQDFGLVPQSRTGRRATVTRDSTSKPVVASTGKRTGLRAQPARKRCFSTSSMTSVDSFTSRTEPSAKKRKPSGSGSMTGKNGKAMSRNAIAARENREKKKAQFRELEEQVEQLQDRNRLLEQERIVDKNSIQQLIKEVSYLRGVVQNTPEISALIRCIRSTPAITNFRTSFGQSLRSKHKIQDENKTPVVSAAAAAASASGKSKLKIPVAKNGGKSGICLHVVNGAVSLEFCSQCSNAAARTK